MPKTHPTKARWNALEEKLRSYYGHAALRCDGHLLYCTRREIAEGKTAIVVYIDGWIEGKNSSVEGSAEALPEPARKFWRTRKSMLYTAAQRNRLVKIFGKRDAKKRGLDDAFYQLVPDWPKAAAFCRHLRRTCERIEILTPEEYDAADRSLREARKKENRDA